MIMSGALALSFCGAAWLALSMQAHWVQVRGPSPLPRHAAPILRVLGAAALCASLLLCFMESHPSMAVLVWVMSLAGAAFLVAMILAWRPRALAVLIFWLRLAAARKQ